MQDVSRVNYPELDQPHVLNVIFHPRPELTFPGSTEADNILIPVDDGERVGATFHFHGPDSPSILFFHGNGEIVADYDQLGQIYTRMGINFLPVDYRGYGRSSGSPSVTAMMRDSHYVFAYVRDWLAGQDCSTPLLVMGRSLGSAPALELASSYQAELSGLIIESGFASVEPLLRLLGLDPDRLGLTAESTLTNAAKIRTFTKPTLIIHAEQDHLIDFSQAEALYAHSPAEKKRLLPIPGANHNNILAMGLDEYMRAITDLISSINPN